jgi:cysteinyl-tRNA synthetase
MKQVFDWAPSEGRDQDVSPELREAMQSGQLADADIEKKIAEMEAARKGRNFTASDALRSELAAAGVVIENTKEGVRWRRK